MQGTAWPALCAWVEGLITRCGLDFVTRVAENVRLWSLSRGTGGGCQGRRGVFHLEPYLLKNGSDLLWGLNEAQFDAFLFGLWMADGEHGQQGVRKPKQALRIATANKILADRLQAIAATRGYRATIRNRVQGSKSFGPGNMAFTLVLVKRSDHHTGTERVAFESGWKPEEVWCVTTESGNIITRRKGRVLVMGNCVEGLDIPRLKCCVLARPTKSLARAIQMMGRVRRPWNGEIARIHDHAFVIKAHGLPDDARDYTLSAKREEPPALTTCEQCLALYSGPSCPACSHENAVKPQGERVLNTVEDAEQYEFSSDTATEPKKPVEVHWDTPGKVLEGTLQRRWEEPGNYGQVTKYQIQGKKRAYVFPGTTRLNKLMARVQIPDLIRVTYIGEEMLHGGRYARNFRVEVDR